MKDAPAHSAEKERANEHHKAVVQAEHKDAHKETKDAPMQQAILGGETVTIATVTLGSLLSSLFVTNTAPSAPTTATWVYPGVLQGVYGDQSIFTVRFEARPYAPSAIKMT